MEISPEGSPSPSAGGSSIHSGKYSIPRPCESTGKTSLESKFSTNSKGVSQHSSENKKAMSKHATGEGGSNENALTTIAEIDNTETPEPIPSKLVQPNTTRSCELLTYSKPSLRSRTPLRPKYSSNVTITT